MKNWKTAEQKGAATTAGVSQNNPALQSCIAMTDVSFDPANDVQPGVGEQTCSCHIHKGCQGSRPCRGFHYQYCAS
jgi:hypothetical protein